MKHLFRRIMTVLFSGWGMLAASADTNMVQGILTADTTWSGTNLVAGTVVITNGVTLSIAPGTRLLMNTSATVVVYGRLLAEGTSNNPITFTRATTAARWKQVLFLNALPSRFAHCVFEFANSVGSQLDYYDNDCNAATAPPARNYHEAIVAVGASLELDDCTFQNLPDTSASAEGDAVAMISDDPQRPGTASARITKCRFISIGQAIHTRYSYVLVEKCLFSGKRGDNDDVDLYGESSPPPMVRFNVFLAGHEDKINPTRCSAIIVGNIISGSDDHGVVLRDKGSPIVINNLIYNCTSAGISVQNQCDALIANNTIVNSQRGIRMFDHFDRHGPPYCLNPGSGRATILNCIIWNCTNSIVLTDSTNGHSYAAVYYCDIKGGQASASVSANSTLVWGPGNINADPQFAGLATNNFRLLPASPGIDAATNLSVFLAGFSHPYTNAASFLTHDFDGLPRYLDGDHNQVAGLDMGAHEFLHPDADSNADGIPDDWCLRFGLNPTLTNLADANPDQDALTTMQEYLAGTDPTDPLSTFTIAAGSGPAPTLQFQSATNRLYTLLFATNLLDPRWQAVPGQTNIPGTGSYLSLGDNNPGPRTYYRMGVHLP